MNVRLALAACILTAFGTTRLPGQEKDAARPILRLEAGGPTSNITGLAWSVDGKTLYAAGYDKVIRAWTLNPQAKGLELDDAATLRVPIGTGLDGALSALAISADGQWLATGGVGIVSGGMKFSEPGRLIPVKGALTPAMQLERGLIYLFNTRDRSVRILRGHTGPILNLAFDTTDADRLLSVADVPVADTKKAATELMVWDTVKQAVVESRTMPAVPFARHPGLALVGPRAVLAWEDNNLTDWSVGGNQVRAFPDGRFNTALAMHTDGQRILSTSVKDRTGQVRQWRLGTTGPVAGAALQLPPPQSNQYEMPLAVAWLGANAVDAAVVVRVWETDTPKTGENYKPKVDLLYVFDARPASFGRVKARIALAQKNNILPTLAAAPDGKRIAIGGFADHQIRVVDVTNLKAAPQLLHSAGATMASVRFVRRGLDTGLALVEQGATKGEWVFDFSGRSLSRLKDAGGAWTDDPRPRGEYSATAKGRTATLLRNPAAGKAAEVVAQIQLKEGIVTAVEVLDHPEAPLLAVASYTLERGSTVLDIYNGKTRDAIRRYVGHLAPIRHLSFRGDGKLLASAAEDQTVAVWSLGDLKEILGQNGGLGELAVEARDGALVVADAASVEELKPGDVVRGIYDKAGALKPLKVPAALYEALWLGKPGQTVKLGITRDGADADPEVRLRQGVDVRKPLFTMFFPRNADGSLGEWLGWNAIGPYEASRRDVEKYLGWHFNTGKADQPTAFAFIDQYRKEYFREGLLKEMVALGDLPPPPKPAAPKQVLLAPGVAQDGALLAQVGADYLLRKPTFQLHVTIPGYEPLPGDELTWRLGDGAARAFEPAEGNLWSAPVKLPPLSARHRVTVSLKRQPEGWPAQEFTKDLNLRFQAPAPRVELLHEQEPVPQVRDKAFTLRFRVHPGIEGQEMAVTLSQEANGQKATRDLGKHAKALAQDVEVTLQPGANSFTVAASNVGSLEGSSAEEASAATFQVVFEEKKDPPPSILLDKALLPAGDPIALRPGTPLEVEVPRCSLLGQFVSQASLTVAQWDTGPDSQRREIVYKAPKGGPARFRIDLDLKPGPQQVRLFARTAGSEEVVARHVVVYRPQLPRPVISRPEAGFQIQGTEDQATIDIEVKLAPPLVPSPTPFELTAEAQVMAQGQRRSANKVTLKSDADKLVVAGLTVVPGDNEVRISLRHAWGGPDQVHEIQGRYARPPKMVDLRVDPVGEKPFVNVHADVASPVPPLAEHVRVRINGKIQSTASLEVRKGAKPGLWHVVAKQVPLAAEKGKETLNRLSVALATAEGEVEAALPEALVYKFPPGPPPQVILLEPGARDAIVSEPTFKLKFKVVSETKLNRVEVARGQKSLKRWDTVPAPVDGVHEFDLPDLGMESGVNHLTIEAFNEDGVRAVPLNLTYSPRPVQVQVDYVQMPGGAKIMAQGEGDLAVIPVGRGTLHGTVRWSDANSESLRKTNFVRVYVNGFQQLPVALKTVGAEPRTRHFEIPVVLNSEENDLEIELPDLKQDAGNRRKVRMPCRQPVRNQHLHVLVIAPQDKDETKLVEALAQGLKAQPIGPNIFKSPVYDLIRVHVLARHVQLLEISSRLDRIGETLKERARAGSPNDLCMIYYQGKETEGPKGRVLWTSESSPWLQLAEKDLADNYLARFPGGQVLMTDTLAAKSPGRPGEYRFAVLQRPDPRPLDAPNRVTLASQMAREMPNSATLDQLANILTTQINPFQSSIPDALRNQIKLTAAVGQ